MTVKKSFKMLENELDSIMERIETASYDELDDLLKDYEAGKKLIAELEKRLETAKNKITKAK